MLNYTEVFHEGASSHRYPPALSSRIKVSPFKGEGREKRRSRFQTNTAAPTAPAWGQGREAEPGRHCSPMRVVGAEAAHEPRGHLNNSENTLPSETLPTSHWESRRPVYPLWTEKQGGRTGPASASPRIAGTRSARLRQLP